MGLRKKIVAPTNLELGQVQAESFKVYCNAKDDQVAVMVFDGIVGDEWTETDARTFEHFLAENRDKDVEVRINSVGGLAYDGIAIYNALASHPMKTTAIITGQAASAAALLSQGADEVQMFSNASFMIHRANLVTWGNRHGLEEDIEALDLLDLAIAQSLAARTGLSSAAVLELMDGKGKRDGTTMDATDAAEYGFVDTVIQVNDDSGKAAKAMAADHKAQAQRSYANDVAVRLRLAEVAES